MKIPFIHTIRQNTQQEEDSRQSNQLRFIIQKIKNIFQKNTEQEAAIRNPSPNAPSTLSASPIPPSESTIPEKETFSDIPSLNLNERQHSSCTLSSEDPNSDVPPLHHRAIGICRDVEEGRFIHYVPRT